MKLRKKSKYEEDEALEQTFTAHVIKGNRQVARREVIASKRFRLDEETYLIKPECIFLANVDGELRSVSYYREGNPNPYNFDEDNIGVAAKELDRIFAEDFYYIVTNLEAQRKLWYLFVLVILNLAMFIGLDVYLFFSGVTL